jgi:hypothetical protein
VINRNAPGAARVRRFRGAKRGANVGRCQATSGDKGPWFVQLDGPSGHTQHRAATLRMRLKSGRSAVQSRDERCERSGGTQGPCRREHLSPTQSESLSGGVSAGQRQTTRRAWRLRLRGLPTRRIAVRFLWSGRIKLSAVGRAVEQRWARTTKILPAVATTRYGSRVAVMLPGYPAAQSRLTCLAVRRAAGR